MYSNTGLDTNACIKFAKDAYLKSGTMESVSKAELGK